MISQNPLLLLIDGNNLAHFLYTNLTPGQKMTRDDSQRLIKHLAAYSRTHAQTVEVELCLDRSPGEYDPLPGNLHIFSAEYPQTGDDLLLGRLWFHQYARRGCTVITNDEAILEEVTAARAAGVRVYQFVRRAGLKSPVFQAPEDLPQVTYPSIEVNYSRRSPSLSASIYFRIVTEQRRISDRLASPQRSIIDSIQPGAGQPLLARHAPEIETMGTVGELSEVDLPILDSPTGDADPSAEESDGPYYFLDLEHWAVDKGVRFLLSSFCPAHRAQYIDLMTDFSSDTLRPADLRALAELLIHACGDEPDFARRGALMARVRLALLQARGEPLSLKELAAKIGLKITGLRGRIKHKAHPWVVIV
jgi:hypothetical protein